MRVLFLEAARDDLREGIRYYEAQSPGFGDQVRNEVRVAIHRIRRMPLAWPEIGNGFRRSLLRGFPYGIVYLVREDVILIVSVAHLHREPGHWGIGSEMCFSMLNGRL